MKFIIIYLVETKYTTNNKNAEGLFKTRKN